MTRKNLVRAFDNLNSKKKDDEKVVPGVLGFHVKGVETVEVPNRAGYVFVRLRDNDSEVIQAYNETVSLTYGLPVLVYRDSTDKTKYKIYGRDVERYSNWITSSAYLPRHGTTHSYSRTNPSGADVVWVYGDQFMPMIGIPSGTYGSMNLLIGEYNHYFNNTWQASGNTGTASFSAYKPTGSSARMVLVYLDGDGNPSLRAGDTFFSASVTGVSAVLPFLPAPQQGEFPISAVRLVSGTSVILWDNVYDVRDHFGGNLYATFANTSNAYIVVTGSSNLANERTITAGSDISLTDNGAGSTFIVGIPTGTFSRAGHTHPADISTPTYPAIYDDGVFKGTGTALNFGENINVAFTGTMAFISSIDTSGGGGSDLLIYDNSTFKVTGTAIDFGDNLSVVVTGSIAYITGLGVTGSSGPPGDNTLLIYDDNVFKVTGTALHFNDNLSVVVTGSSAWVNGQSGGSSTGSAAHDYYAYLATLLEPDAIEPLLSDTFSYAISTTGTKLLVASWYTRLGSTGRMEVRDPQNPLPLRGVTLSGLGAGAMAIISDPSLPTYSDARTEYFDKLKELAELPTRYMGFSGNSASSPFLPGPYGTMVTSITVFDYAWIIFRPYGTSLGFNVSNEISDASTQRVFNKLTLPLSKNICSKAETSNHNGSAGITYCILPSTWSSVTDPNAPYDFRDDFMESVLNTGTWARTQSSVGNVEIDTLHQWVKCTGTNTWNTNGMYSLDSITKADGKVFLADVYINAFNNNGHLMLGFSDGGGINYTNLSYGLNFGATLGSPSLSVYENGNARGTVGSGYSALTMYRVRITCTSGNNVTYEIQGGSQYEPIGSDTWDNITPGTSSSADTDLHAGVAVYGGVSYVGDVRIY